MPFAKSGKYKIHYQIEGQGQPLVLYHWSLTTLKSWYELGYVDKLKSDYQLILPDALGHGKSDAPHGLEHYSLEQRVDDLIAVLDAENIKTSHFYGFSMGGWVGFALARQVPERFDTLMLSGAHPFDADLQSFRDLLQSGIEKGMDLFVTEYESMFRAQTPEQKNALLRFDLKALQFVCQNRMNMEQDLDKMPGSKMLLLAGDKDHIFDQIRKCHQKLPGSTLVTLSGLDHSGTCMRTELIVSHINKFLQNQIY